MAEQRIQGIIFDLDGTLYHMKFMKIKMTFLLLRSVGYLKHLFASRAVVRQKEYSSQSQLLEALYEDLADRTGRTVEQTRNWYENIFLPAFVKLLKISGKARGGLIPLLKNLRENDVKLAVISDFGSVESRLKALDIPSRLFDSLRCSEEFGVLKPAPKPFLEVAHEWGIQPEKILVVGDRADRDGQCAHRAQMQFLGITDKKEKRADFYCWKDALLEIGAKTNCGVNL